MTEASVFVGWGSALPPVVVANHDLAARLDTSHDWIVERTGIHERHVGGSVSSLAGDACREALERAGVLPVDVDLVVMATCTSDEVVPHGSSVVHHRLGLGGGAMDVNGSCVGFLHALLVGFGALRTDMHRVLVVGADCMSRVVDPSDRSTAVLFGDGAGAVLLQGSAAASPSDGGPGLVAHDFGTDGSGHDLLVCRRGGTLCMDGREVFRRAVRLTVESATTALDRAKVTPDDIALFVPHQANLRIMESAGSRIGIPLGRTAVSVDHTGNTSAASIPIALAEAVTTGRVAEGDLLMLSAVGAGMAWGTMIIRWGR